MNDLKDKTLQTAAENANPTLKQFDFANAKEVANRILADIPDDYRLNGYTQKAKRFYMLVNKDLLNGGPDAPQVFPVNLCAFMSNGKRSGKPVTEEMCRDKSNRDVHLVIWKHPDENQGYKGFIGILCCSKYDRF